MSNVHPETFAAQAGGDVDEETGAIVPPIHLATTFEREPDLTYRHGYIYSRDGHPGGVACERVIDVLEGGTGTRVFSSGMAAAVTCMMALDRPCHVIAPTVMYWSLRNWMINEAASHGLDITFVDATSVDAVRAAVKPGLTKLIWVETPSNPLWSISDIAALGDLAHDADALLAVDSTPASPVCSQPLSLGADIVMHSVTKYLNGHSDVLGGSLTFREMTSFTERVAKLRTSHGNNLAGFESALLLRGMRTVHVRVARQCETAMRFARHFADDRRVAAVLYPGLPSHDGHEIATRQMPGGFGGMLSVRCAGGRDHAVATVARLKTWKRATSLGGVESLAEHRASIEGEGTPCPDDLIRLSVGLEAADDLITDFDEALG